MSGSSSSGSSKVAKGYYESNRGVENPQAQQLLGSLTGYLTNAFNEQSPQRQATSDAGTALSSVLTSGGENPYLQEYVQSIKDNYANDLAKSYAQQYAQNQGLGEITKRKMLSDVVSQNQLQQNKDILEALIESWNAGQDRTVEAAGTASEGDPAARLGDTATALITNLTKEWGYQPITTSKESRYTGSIKN